MKKLITILFLLLLSIGCVSSTAQNSKSNNSISAISSKITNQSEMTQAQKSKIIQKAIDNMVFVEGGSFTMGLVSEQGCRPDSKDIPHKVVLSDYYIGKTEVTQELWLALMGTNPSKFKGNNQRPVENVSWNDCQTFIAKLNQVTGLGFRLPTEAEWEFAARGGNHAQSSKYAGGNNISDLAWNFNNCHTNDSTHPEHGTHQVATKCPNALGLFDMSGNVAEWCLDYKDHFTSDEQTNPAGPEIGSRRVIRGGNWSSFDIFCTVLCRHSHSQDFTSPFYGLRLALDDPSFSPRPIINTNYRDESITITAIGKSNNDVKLQINGNPVDNPYIAHRNSEPYNINIKATETEKGLKTSTISKDFIISAKVVTPDNTETFIANNVAFKMVTVPAGTFMMGASKEQDSDGWNEPAQQVTLSKYAIGQTEVTQELWIAVMGNNPSTFSGCMQLPVENISWEECQSFITKLNQLTGKHFRLPTEAEWEFAARGGNKSCHYKYSGSNNLNDVSWYIDNNGCSSRPVATKLPNELGLYDMSGNVMEWCQDSIDSYSSAVQTNPTGSTLGQNHVFRGGSWTSVPETNSVYYRRNYNYLGKSDSIGFRLAL